MAHEDDDTTGGGTIVMRPPDDRAQADQPSNEGTPEDPATLLKPASSGTLQMAAVDGSRRGSYPRPDHEFTPSATAPIGLIPPSELARGLPGLGRTPLAPPEPALDERPPAPIEEPPTPPPPLDQPEPSIHADTAPLVTVGQPLGRPYNPLAHAPTQLDVRGKQKGLFPVLLGAGIGLSLMLLLAVLIILMRSSPSSESVQTAASSIAIEETAAATASATETAAAEAVVSNAPVASSGASALPTEGPDAEAIAALEKLRAGIDACVKTNIHKLPGTSPAVPQSLGWLKHGPYTPLPRDWASPFFACTKFKLEKPMPFVLQWQVEKPSVEGRGIAWIDTDRDGTAERAYAFRGKLVGRDRMEFGPIEAADTSSKPRSR
ncbi:MAG: hypothetical protein HOW73_07930 [Polyangiaceae bacterium]|nr:hypothetical protein [Polyangiaceae bacterium]